MATEIRRERAIGIFKPTVEAKMKAKRRKENFRAKRPGMSDDHLACIRKLPCCTCLKVPAGQASHLKDTPDKERGMGLKSSDKWAVPQCNDCHINGVERVGARNELAWFKARGVDALSLAQALWHSTEDLAKMVKIVIEHHGSR